MKKLTFAKLLHEHCLWDKIGRRFWNTWEMAIRFTTPQNIFFSLNRTRSVSGENAWRWLTWTLDGRAYLTKSVCKVVLQKSIPTQIRQLIFIWVTVKDKLTNLWGSWLLQNDFRNTLCEINKCTRWPWWNVEPSRAVTDHQLNDFA